MYKKIKLYGLLLLTGLMLFSVSCKKGTFDINKTNPNVPSSVDPGLILTAALVNTAGVVAGGTADFADYYMGYWAVSGDYIPVASTVQYTINTDFFAGNWDASYIILRNFKSLEDSYNGDAKGDYFVAISNIMKAFIYQRLVDIYNDIPYSEALNGGTNNFPVYDNAKTVYTDLVVQLNAAVAKINAASGADDPAGADVMFGGDMTKWATFANTLKLKILMRLTETDAAAITAGLAGMTTADFIGVDADAGVNPGYVNDVGKQNPMWAELGSTPTGSNGVNTAYYRANNYAVNFYKDHSDPRLGLFYAPVTSSATGNDTIVGRPFGSTALEHNADISGIAGPSKGQLPATTSGLLQSPTQSVILISSAESFFLQAEAIQRGYLPGSAEGAYQNGVQESFRYLGVTQGIPGDYVGLAIVYTAQAGDATNFAGSTNKIKTIITQKWAANNTIDPLESWSDWRRLGIPADLPVSIYPGTTATHIPFRLRYPTTEYNYNAANVPPDASINPISSKIFWMP